MTPVILESPTPPVASPSPGVDRESLILDGLDLNDGATRTLVGLEFTPAKKLLEWIKGPDSDGAKLLRMARHENSEFDLRLFIRGSDRDDVLDTVGGVIDKLQEAERQHANGGRGLELVWSPMGSSYSYTFYLLVGESNLLRAEDFYKLGKPHLDLKLYCSPFGYGPEVSTSTTTSNDVLIEKSIADVPGDVPAELRVTVTDGAGQNRDYVAVGLHHYSFDVDTDLLHDSTVFVTSGFAGSVTTRTGARGDEGVVRATLTTTPVAVCSSAELTHIGTFRNLFRLWPSSTNVSVRMAWRQGRDQWTAEPWQAPPFEDNFWEPDLGQCKIRASPLGTQTWQWRIEAKSTVAGDELDVDYHIMIPSDEGYDKARKTLTFETSTSFTARNEFNQAGPGLTGTSLDVGGGWTAFGGDTDDWALNTIAATAERTVTTTDTALPNATATGRAISAGTGTLAAITAQMDFKHSAAVGCCSGLLLRAANTSNYVVFYFRASGMLDGAFLQTRVVAASESTPTNLFQTSNYTFDINTWYTLRIQIDVAGRWVVWYFPTGTTPSSPFLSGIDSAMATGGALASGKFGIFDRAGSGACTRSYDNFNVFVPSTDAAIFANQSAEFRSYGDDPVLREDSTGTYWGRPGEVRGGRLWLPPAGAEDRTTELAVLARRNDIETQPSTHITDPLSVTAHYRPRYVNVPRQA